MGLERPCVLRSNHLIVKAFCALRCNVVYRLARLLHRSQVLLVTVWVNSGSVIAQLLGVLVGVVVGVVVGRLA